MPYVYIIHTTETLASAHRLCDYLLKAGYDVWAVRPQSLADRMLALTGAHAVLLLMSKVTLASTDVEKLAQLAVTLKKTVVPITLDGTIFPAYQHKITVKLPPKRIPKDIASWLRLAIQRQEDGTGHIIREPIDDSALTSIAKPKSLQDLAKALRTGLDSTSDKRPE